MDTIAITGATGFIGKHVVHCLQKLNNTYNIIAIGRVEERLRSLDVDYVVCDLNEKLMDCYEIMGRPDVLIHLAWDNLENYNNLIHMEKNLFLHYRFLKNMIESGLNSLVITGTCFEYGMQSGALNEAMATMPENPYGLAKDTLRKFLVQLQKKFDFEFKWIRLFYMYGKGQNPSSILSQLDKALENEERYFNMSKGEQLRDYLPVEKVAEYIVKIAIQNKVHGIINCCSGVPVSIRTLVEDYLTKKQKNIHLNLGHYPYPEYEPMAFWGDRSHLLHILNNIKDKG